MIAKIAAKVLDKIKGKQGTVCQGYYCEGATGDVDPVKQWEGVLGEHGIKMDDAALARVSAMPLTRDEMLQTVVELKTADRSVDTIPENEAEGAVKKVLADNVLMARRAAGKARCVPGGPNNTGTWCLSCGPNNNVRFGCEPCGPAASMQVNHCGSCGPNGGGTNFTCEPCGPAASMQVNHCGSCGPNGGGTNFVCATCGPMNSSGAFGCTACGPTGSGGGFVCSVCGPSNSGGFGCAVCGPALVGNFGQQCSPAFDFGGGCVAAFDPASGRPFDPRDIIRLSEQVAQLAAEVQKLRSGK